MMLPMLATSTQSSGKGPIGRFGPRLHGGKDAAKARYIHTVHVKDYWSVWTQASCWHHRCQCSLHLYEAQVRGLLVISDLGFTVASMLSMLATSTQSSGKGPIGHFGPNACYIFAQLMLRREGVGEGKGGETGCTSIFRVSLRFTVSIMCVICKAMLLFSYYNSGKHIIFMSFIIFFYEYFHFFSISSIYTFCKLYKDFPLFLLSVFIILTIFSVRWQNIPLHCVSAVN